MQQTAEEPPQPSGAQREYWLSEQAPSAAAVLEALTTIAPKLNGAELRVYLTLLHAAAANPPHWTVKASTDLITERTGLARSSVIPAIASLTARRYITARRGGGRTTSAYKIHALDIVPMRGPKTGPLQTTSRGPEIEPLDSTFPTSRGPEIGPVQNLDPSGVQKLDPSLIKEHAHEHASIRFDIDKIDRSINALPTDHPPEAISATLGWIASYYQRHGKDASQTDPAIVAQLLTACGSTAQAERLIRDMIAERRPPGDSPAYLIAVALQRLHGIAPQDLAARRDQLRQQRRRQAGSETTNQPRGGLRSVGAADFPGGIL